MDGNACYLLVWKYSMWVDVYVTLIMRVWQVSNQGSKNLTELKAKSNCIWRFEQENLTLALVGIFIILRRQAIDDIFLWIEIPSTLQGRAWFHSSNHITLVNYLDSMGSLWGYMFTGTWKNARNKEYASLFMEAHGVHKVNWHDSLSLNLVINKEKH